MSDISFAREWMLLLLPVVPGALAAWWVGVRRAAARARTISRSRSAPPPYAAAVLFALAAAVAIVAAAQPRWGTRESKVERNGADLVIVLDISRSMAARDVAPDRLSAAKTSIDSTLSRLGGDRVGLVVFAGEARIRFPLTTDFTAARQVVDTLETGVVFVEGGTNAGLGLAEAVTLLSDDQHNGKVILLLTDGDDLSGDFATSAQLVAQSGASLLVAGVGTPDGATIPVVDPRNGIESPKLGADQAPIVTKLNETFLKTLSAAAGGRYLGSDLAVVPGAVDGRLRALQRPDRLPAHHPPGRAVPVLRDRGPRAPRAGIPCRAVAAVPLASGRGVRRARSCSRLRDQRVRGQRSGPRRSRPRRPGHRHREVPGVQVLRLRPTRTSR
ncbi:MAG: VWA domain-containing protein [Dehalococcoidia bacterium]